eukprot:6181110-Pleurochrysis_carterae.AAC.1
MALLRERLPRGIVQQPQKCLLESRRMRKANRAVQPREAGTRRGDAVQLASASARLPHRAYTSK